ncbi:unnamed protein product, partial [marine sediment metagenome]
PFSDYYQNHLPKTTKPPPLYMRNGVFDFKLIAPSLKGHFEENALLDDMSIG